MLLNTGIAAQFWNYLVNLGVAIVGGGALLAAFMYLWQEAS